MRILITNLYLQSASGSESYAYTLGKALRERGHEVVFYTHDWGWYGDQIRADGFECWVQELKHNNFDVVHFQHTDCVATLHRPLSHIPKVFISHGKLPKQEQAFCYEEFPMEGYAGVSEETLDNAIAKAHPPADTPTEILRNPIDTDLFSTDVPINEELKNVLIISNNMLQKPQYVNLIRQACKEMGLGLEIIGSTGTFVEDTRPYIERADLIVGLGRCAYEAMSMGRNVLVFDYLGFEGLVSDETYLQFRQYNLSGRFRNYTNPTLGDVRRAFEQYSPKQGISNQKLIKKHHDSHVVAGRAERFYETLEAST